MKIYTKTGDEGETGLFGGQRVYKSNDRIEAYGTLDELNAFIGLLRDHLSGEEEKLTLFTIQNRLFSLGAYLATPPKEGKEVRLDILEEDVELLEKEMDRMDALLEPLRNFILPGGHPQVAYAHLCRTICRRAERQCVRLHLETPINTLAIHYLNRLSDYFFILARHLSQQLGVEEITWKGRN
ncbi:cob(I)yrinic acid a,c-diamide adenosyltransferase [Lewinella sp. LCG006]|uniref:cob(I)yrinic acid a,c-diamide adenosyltransferase n=1 Tax=Lewinella sp. LCG006 TaxID=3231911 RepID=UPI003460F53B